MRADSLCLSSHLPSLHATDASVAASQKYCITACSSQKKPGARTKKIDKTRMVSAADNPLIASVSTRLTWASRGVG